MNKIFLCFCEDVTATACARIAGVNRNTVNSYYNRIRELMFEESLREAGKEFARGNNRLFGNDALGDKSKLPIDADANGAYHIALKGLLLLQRFSDTEDANLKKADLRIANKDWFSFRQKKECLK